MGRIRKSSKWIVVLTLLCMAAGTAWGAGPAWMPSFPLRAGDNILLMWLPTPGAQSYNVYRSEGGAPPQKIGSTPAPTYNDTFPDKTKTVEYIVRAVVNGAEGDPSAKGIIKGVEPLKAPVITGNRIVGGTKMAIIWGAVPKAVFYNVYKADKVDGEYKLLTSAQETQYVDAAVKNGETYYYQVSVVDAGSVESPKSAVLTAKVELAVDTTKKKEVFALVQRNAKRVWRSRGEANFELTGSKDAVVTKDGNIAVVSGRDVQVIGKDGQYVSRFGGAPSSDQEVAWGVPIGIGLSADGATYAVTYQNPSFIRTFDADGKLQKETVPAGVDPKTTTDGYVRPPIVTDADFAADGTIWATENVNFQLLHYSADLKEIGRFGKPIGDKKRNNDEELVVPSRIAIDRKTGKIYISETMPSRVSIWDKDGKRLKGFGQAGDDPGDINVPTGIAVSNGELVVACANTGRITYYDLDGKYLATLKDPSKKEKEMVFGSTSGLAASGARIFLAEDVRSHLLAFDVTK